MGKKAQSRRGQGTPLKKTDEKQQDWKIQEEEIGGKGNQEGKKGKGKKAHRRRG